MDNNFAWQAGNLADELDNREQAIKRAEVNELLDTIDDHVSDFISELRRQYKNIDDDDFDGLVEAHLRNIKL